MSKNGLKLCPGFAIILYVHVHTSGILYLLNLQQCVSAFFTRSSL